MKLSGGRIPRICEVLAASPFSVSGRESKSPRPLVGESEVRAAEEFLHNRRTVVFADDVYTDPFLNRPTLELLDGVRGFMPPFPRMWVEWVNPGSSFSHAGIGVSVDFVDPRRANECGLCLSVLDTAARKQQDLAGVVRMGVWIQGPTGHVTREGLLGVGTTREHRAFTADPNALTYQVSGTNSMHAELFGCIAAVVAHTIGLMNASNHRLVEGGHTADDVSERRRWRDRLPWIKYHVIKLRKGTALVPLRVYPRDPRDESGRPLIAVRGHYRDFSKNGLFGKFKGDRYSHIWVPSFYQGEAENGVVHCDYDQKAGAA